MKIAEALKVIDAGWVRKPKGFRVRFRQRTADGWETIYSPGENAKPMESDVVTWRLAWKLAQAGRPEGGRVREGDMVDVEVIDEAGNTVPYYATGRETVFNPLEETGG